MPLREFKPLILALTLLQALGMPYPLLLPPMQLAFPIGPLMGCAHPMAQVPDTTEKPCLEPAILPLRLNGV